MYGIDIISVLNKAIDNNRIYEDYPVYKVNVKFTYDLETGQAQPGEKNIKTDIQSFNLFEDGNFEKKIKQELLGKVTDSNDNFVHNFKMSAFRCTGIKYVTKKDTNDNLAVGRLKEITFEQKK